MPSQQLHESRDNERRRDASPRTVLVLGEDYRIVLPTLRSLGRRGIEMHLAWCRDDDIATRSRWLAAHHTLTPFAAGESAWKDDLNNLLHSHQFDLVIPATEEAVHILQTHRREICESQLTYLLDDDAFQTVFDKQQTYRLAESLSIPCPQSRLVVSRQDALAALDEFGLPAIIKPCSSVSDGEQLGKQFVRVCRSREDALAYVDFLIARNTPAMMQSFFDGVGVGVELLAKRGAGLVAMQHQRLHETTGHGSTYRKTVPLDAELLDAASSLMRALNYTGVAMVEFRVDPATGRWVLLEINGRFWGSLPLACAAGADFPWYLYQLLVEGRRDFPTTFRAGVRSRAFREDLRWTWRRLRTKGDAFRGEEAQNLGWTVNRLPLTGVAIHWLRALCLLDHVDSFAWDDPWPAICEITQLAGSALSRCGKRTGKDAESATKDQATSAQSEEDESRHAAGV